MKITLNKSNRGFTLIEMIGVLAVIAILAAVLIPRVFEAINSARVNGAVMACQTIKTAMVDHYGKYGSFTTALNNGTQVTGMTIPIQDFGAILFGEQLIDKPFETKISGPYVAGTPFAATPTAATGTHVEVQTLAGAVIGTTPVTATSATFDLNGDSAAGSEVTDIAGSGVAIAILTAVTANDAWDMSRRIDGDTLTAATSTVADLKGRVKYAAPDATTGLTDVYVYLTHR